MTALVCSRNAAVAYDYLIGKGLSDFQAAGVIGNLQQESGINPNALNYLGAYGIAQWLHSSRRQAMASFAAARGADPSSLEFQLEFLWHELETKPEFGLSQLRASRTLEEAVVVFQDRFERPGAHELHTDKRIRYAQAALFACPSVAPQQRRKSSIVVSAVGIAALVAVAGYGAMTLLKSPRRPAMPRPSPPPPERHPPFDYRSRL